MGRPDGYSGLSEEGVYGGSLEANFLKEATLMDIELSNEFKNRIFNNHSTIKGNDPMF